MLGLGWRKTSSVCVLVACFEYDFCRGWEFDRGAVVEPNSGFVLVVPYCCRDTLSDTATSLGERLLVTPRNPISLAMTLDGLAAAAAAAGVAAAPASSSSQDGVRSGSQKQAPSGSGQKASVSFFGSMLWARWDFFLQNHDLH